MTDETAPAAPSNPEVESAADDRPALPNATESTPVAGISYHAPMSRGDVAVLALRLLGVFAIFQGSAFLSLLGTVFSGLGSGVGDWGRTLVVAAPYGIHLGLGIVLVATAGWLGPKLLPDA